MHFRYGVGRLSAIVREIGELQKIHQFLVTKSWGVWPDRLKNPLSARPRKYWSQADEDGILEEIFSRMELCDVTGTFIEFGVGDGSECDTLSLL